MSSVYSRNYKTLNVLKEALRKLGADNEKTPALLELREIMAKRIAEIERELKIVTGPRRTRK